ncbi:MAG: hypothetical protein DHS20C15_05010 [Planctomycetota bacterium]|nr:MAG: hypothetical protein DHS20C15_05010 [Planctomycetota bacterium]
MPDLPSLALGQPARLLQVGGPRSYRRRLMELGFVPGTELRLLRRNGPGKLLEVELRGGRVSLRAAEARVLEVEALA